MRGLWQRHDRLEGELRALRTEPRRDFVHSWTRRLESRRSGHVGLRVALAAGLTAVLAAGVAVVGGAAYAKSITRVVKAPTSIVRSLALSRNDDVFVRHVTICHATGNGGFVQISPSAGGVFNGHLGHHGGADIIPPFRYNGQTYSQNWNAIGMDIWEHSCEGGGGPGGGPPGDQYPPPKICICHRIGALYVRIFVSQASLWAHARAPWDFISTTGTCPRKVPE